MAGADHTIAFNADEAFVRAVADDGFGMRLTGTSPKTLGLFGLCAALGVVAIVRDSAIWWVLAFMVPPMIGFPAVGWISWIRRRLRRSIAAQYAALPEPKRITVDLSETGLRFTNARESQDVPWDQLSDVIMGDRVWYIKLTSGLGIPIPADAIGPAARERLTAARDEARKAAAVSPASSN